MDFSEIPSVSSRRAEAVAAVVVLLTLVAVSLGAGRSPARDGALVHAPLVHAPSGRAPRPRRARTGPATPWWARTRACPSTSRASPAPGSSRRPTAARATPIRRRRSGSGSEATTRSRTTSSRSAPTPTARAASPRYYAWYELIPAPPVMLVDQDQAGRRDHHVGERERHHRALPAQEPHAAHGVHEARGRPMGSTSRPPSGSPRRRRRAGGRPCEPVPLANFGTHDFSRIATIGDDHPGTLVDPAWTTVPIQLVPSSRGGFFPGPERGARAPSSTAGTSPPTNPSTDGRTFSLSWLAKAP